jgi:hypothetical protein
MKNVGWTDRVRKEGALKTVKGDRNILQTIKRGRLTRLVTSCLLKHVTEGKIEGGQE